MSTDLTKTPDHPATVLRAEGAKSEGFLAPLTRGDLEAMPAAAGVLRGYEATHDVTFAALDNEALALVQETYDRAHNARYGTAMRAQSLEGLAAAVRDLLGLGSD